MKKVLAITLMLLLCATVAMATEASWRITLKADNGSGGNPGSGASVGVYAGALEGLDAQDGAVYAFGTDLPGLTAIVGAVVTGATPVYGKSIKADTIPIPEKTWDLYVAANASATMTVIRIRAYTVNGQMMSTAHVGTDTPPGIKYYLRMVDNKGKVGAPADGAMWELPVPAAHSTTPFWNAPNLPVIKLSVGTSGALVAEGYKMQFVQVGAIPEPSGMLALGAGLLGLVGFVTRRRK